MRLQIVKSKNAQSFYVVKSTYINKKRSNKVVEKLGTLEDLKLRAGNSDPIQWAKDYVAKLTEEEKNGTRKILIKYDPLKTIEKNHLNNFNCGYLFLEKIYNLLGLQNICKEISKKYKFEYDLNSILSRLIFSRILFPSSKLGTYEISKRFLEPSNFELHEIYRALQIINKENEFIQKEVYKNSTKVFKRNTNILYYDCTNYFFEIEQEYGLKQYGPSKEHRPNPIIQMGLFMDADGIPLAFDITAGNKNEQITLKPIEQRIINDFNFSKFIICTDAGLASNANRKFNNVSDKSFITTQSIKKLKKYLKDWALEKNDWKLFGDSKTYDISKLNDNEESYNYYYDKTFYKERWINENDIEQKLIITFSLKYQDYQRKIRNSQIERAKKMIENNSMKIDKCNPNDCKRFIKKTAITKDGEIAENKKYSLNLTAIEKEEQFDGFYGVCTNLDDSPENIIKINQRRWEIEECFRILKTEFKARPVYLQRDDRIIAHFITCFLALIVLRLLEKELNEEYTIHEIIDCLRNMDLLKNAENGYIPAYTRTDLTDKLHEKFGFRTDYEILNKKTIKNIFKKIK